MKHFDADGSVLRAHFLSALGQRDLRDEVELPGDLQLFECDEWFKKTKNPNDKCIFCTANHRMNSRLNSSGGSALCQEVFEILTSFLEKPPDCRHYKDLAWIQLNVKHPSQVVQARYAELRARNSNESPSPNIVTRQESDTDGAVSGLTSSSTLERRIRRCGRCREPKSPGHRCQNSIPPAMIGTSSSQVL